jgi:hypothetical protein
MTVLSTNSAIRNAIQKMLGATNRRRVVISGFVGAGAEALIPNPEGVEVYCWDREGATNPQAVRALLQQRAKVFFAPGLHAKVYWAEGKGCIVGSANLSQNGLGKDGLHEVAVQLPPRRFDLNGFLRRLKLTTVTEPVLNEFEERCRRYRGRNSGQELLSSRGWAKRAQKRTPTFAEWMAMEYRMPWNLEVTDTYFNDREEKEIVRRGVMTDEDVGAGVDYWTGQKGMTTPGRWVLFVEVTRNGRGFEASWCCADERTPSRRLGPDLQESSAPWFAIQRSETKHFGPVPFNVAEPGFQTALKRFLKAHRAMNYVGARALAPNGQLKRAHLFELLRRCRTKR